MLLVLRTLCRIEMKGGHTSELVSFYFFFLLAIVVNDTKSSSPMLLYKEGTCNPHPRIIIQARELCTKSLCFVKGRGNGPHDHVVIVLAQERRAAESQAETIKANATQG